jgi:hypothetical protein
MGLMRLAFCKTAKPDSHVHRSARIRLGNSDTGLTMPRKPTGKIGPLIATGGPSGLTLEWSQIKFPEKKEDIEQLICDLWAAEVRKAGHGIRSIRRNGPDDFDFTIELPGGIVSLDLAELFYRDAEGRPYEGTKIEIKTYRYAEQIRDAVLKKSDHYGRAGAQPIHLLTYVTHWRFGPNETVIRLVQHFLNEKPPIIENVFLVMPFNASTGVLWVLFPSRDPLKGRSPSEFKEHFYYALDPAKWQVANNRS